MPRVGIEPTTPGFSDQCSTTELPRHNRGIATLIILAFFKKEFKVSCLVFSAARVLVEYTGTVKCSCASDFLHSPLQSAPNSCAVVIFISGNLFISKRELNPSPPIPPGSTWLLWVVPLSVALITLIVFLPVLKNGFVNWDDIGTLLYNQKYRGLGWQQLKWMFTTFYMGPYQPLSWMTYGLDYLIWGMNPFGYHLTNVVLHSINAAVFCLLCVKLLVLAAGPVTQEKRADLYLSAGFAALFFAIHPLRVESVAWVTERRDVLSGLFYILAILFYIQPRSTGSDHTSPWRRHLMPLAAFLFALLSKGIAISLPVVLVMLDIYPLKRLLPDQEHWFSREACAVWLEKVPYFALAAVFGMVGFMGQVGISALNKKPSFAAHITQVLFAVGLYIWKTLVPVKLTPFYLFTGALTDWQPLLAGTAALAITMAAIVLRRRWPAVLAVWFYYLVTLSPVSGIAKMGAQTAADRYTYLPCLGFAALAGAGFWAGRQTVNRFFKNFVVIAACIIISVLSLMSWRQTKIWRDSITLWNHTLTIDPELAFVHNLLGLALSEQGKINEAFHHFNEALRINPDYWVVHTNFGVLLAENGQYAEAVKHYAVALRTKPGFAETHINMCTALVKLGKYSEAVKHCQEALRLSPDNASAYFNLGNAMVMQGKMDEAVKYYRSALRISPDYIEAKINLGVAEKLKCHDHCKK